MAFSLEDIRVNEMGAPRIVIYGVPGIGKSTLAANAPNPVFVQVEDGLGQLEVAHGPLVDNYSQIKDQLQFFAEDDHDFETLVVDTIDALEPLIWDDVCKADGKKSIEDFGFGKGFMKAADEHRKVMRLINKCRDRGMLTIMLAHSHVVKFESPESDAYDRYSLRLHKKAAAMWTDWADAVLFYNYSSKVVSAEGDRKRAVGKGERVLFTEERPAYIAKNRYGLPHKLSVTSENPWQAIGEHL